jgi:hypothetical protein
MAWLLYWWLVLLVGLALACVTRLLAYNLIWNGWHDYWYALKTILIAAVLCVFVYFVQHSDLISQALFGAA